jgi:(2R)-ethylmalonyl-CoA mutase
MKSRLVEANAERIRDIEQGETTVVGVNKFTAGEPSPLTAGDEAIMVADADAEQDQIERLTAWRTERNDSAVKQALDELSQAAATGINVMPASIKAAKAGATTGEWGDVVRTAFGQYRGPTGVSQNPSNRTEGLENIRAAVNDVSDKLGRRLKFLVGKPGLDGHSNGAEQIAARARDCGMDISYEGIRCTPVEIVSAALEDDAHVIGLSILSGSHIPLMGDLMEKLRTAGLAHIPVVVGGIIPEDDADRLRAMGVAKVYTPKDFELNRIMTDLVALVESREVAAQ